MQNKINIFKDFFFFWKKESASSVKLGTETAAYEILSNLRNGFTLRQTHDYLRSDD